MFNSRSNIYQVTLLLCLLFTSCQEPSKEWVQTTLDGSPDLHDIEAVNDDLAYAYSYGTGLIYKTTDGSKTWNKIAQLDSIFFEQIQFVDENKGWICGERGKVFRTVDGGNTWEDISIPIPEGTPTLLFYALYFEDENRGFVNGFAYNRDTRTRILNSYHTEDGGESWTPVPERLMLMGVEKGPNNEIWAVGGGAVLKKPALADEWEFMILRGNADSVNVEDVRTIGFNDSTVIAANFRSGGLLISENLGEKWRLQPLTSNRIRSVIHFNKQWLAVGDTNEIPGNLFTSSDNGVTWETDTTNYPDIHRLSLSENYVWMVGKSGFVARRRR